MSTRLSPPRLLPVTIVVMLLLLSAKAVTFARDAGAALGLMADAATIPAVATASGLQPSPAAAVALKQPASEQVGAAEKALLQDLRKRREQLDARTRTLDKRNSVIEAAEATLQAKIDRLTALQDKIDQLDQVRRKRQDADWSGLVKVYESMRPRDAASIFDVLDMHVLLEVLDRMNDRKAAAILAAMQPERARMATQMLAQMRLQRDTPVSLLASDTAPKTSTQQ